MALVVCLSFNRRSKTFCWQKISRGPGGHEVEYDAAICHGDRGWLVPGLHWTKNLHQVEGGGLFLLISTGDEAIPVVLCPVLGSSVQRRQDVLERV